MAKLPNKEGVTLDYLVVVCICYDKYVKQVINLLNSVKDINLPSWGEGNTNGKYRISDHLEAMNAL